MAIRCGKPRNSTARNFRGWPISRFLASPWLWFTRAPHLFVNQFDTIRPTYEDKVGDAIRTALNGLETRSMLLLSSDVLRLLLAAFLGGAIGLERELSRKPAGLRTNMFICFGAA